MRMRAILHVTLAAFTLAACGRTQLVTPSAVSQPWIRSDVVPHHLHVEPFFNFRGKRFGEQPVPGLIGDSSDNLYGVTQAGGNQSCVSSELHLTGCGIVYKLTHVSGLRYTQSIVHAFDGKDGQFPGSPLSGGNGAFFGTTTSGGAHGKGTVFSISVATGRFKTLYSFQGGSSDGDFPKGRIYVDSKGNLFGTTAFGGGGTCARGCGTVFELVRNGTRYSGKIVYRFKGGADGWEPWAGVSEYNGALYGTTIYGGSAACKQGCGTVFRLARARKSTLHAFAGGSEGAYVRSPLYVDASGDLYGEAQNGGDTTCTIAAADAPGCGTIFEVTSKGRTKVLHKFRGGYYGAQPNTGLTLFKNVLYGTTIYGGTKAQCSTAASGCGIAFNINPNGNGYGVIGAFNAAKRNTPVNPALFLCAITDELNGTTSSGGEYGYGTIFKLIP